MNEPESTSTQSETTSPAPVVLKEGIFISYTQSDSDWAEWIAWTLEEAGYKTYIQLWDCRPGLNFREFMHRAITGSKRTIAVLSEEYQTSHWTSLEWNPPFDADPDESKRFLLPVLVRRYKPYGPLGARNYINLVGVDENAARERLLSAFDPGDKASEGASSPTLARDRLKPSKVPKFPGQHEEEDAQDLQFKSWPRLNSACVRLVCTGLVSLSLAYFLGSEVVQGKDGAYWDRLFNAFGDPSKDLFPIGFGPAWLIEAFRIMLLLIIALVFMPGWLFQDTAGLLMEETPLRKWFGSANGAQTEATPRWESKVGFGVLVFLFIVFFVVVLSNDLVSGPQYLWDTQGVPENRPKGIVHLFDRPLYLRTCILPYVVYTVYALINFAIAVNIIMTLSITAVVTDLVWMARWVSQFENDYKTDKIKPADLLRHFKATFLNRLDDVLDRYYCLLTILLVGLSYLVWLDKINLTPQAYQLEREAMLVAGIPLAILLPLSTVFFIGARAAVAKRASSPNAFLRDHSTLDYYLRSLTRSRYTWISGLGLVSVLANYLLGYHVAR